MKEFDKLILQGFHRYCVSHDIDITDHISLRLAGATYGHQIMNIILEFIEWSIEDDCNNSFNNDVKQNTREGGTDDRL